MASMKRSPVPHFSGEKRRHEFQIALKPARQSVSTVHLQSTEKAVISPDEAITCRMPRNKSVNAPNSWQVSNPPHATAQGL
jgi:hypothetical protein